MQQRLQSKLPKALYMKRSLSIRTGTFLLLFVLPLRQKSERRPVPPRARNQGKASIAAFAEIPKTGLHNIAARVAGLIHSIPTVETKFCHWVVPPTALYSVAVYHKGNENSVDIRGTARRFAGSRACAHPPYRGGIPAHPRVRPPHQLVQFLPPAPRLQWFRHR